MIFIKKVFRSCVIVVFKFVNLKYVDLKIARIKIDDSLNSFRRVFWYFYCRRFFNCDV